MAAHSLGAVYSCSLRVQLYRNGFREARARLGLGQRVGGNALEAKGTQGQQASAPRCAKW